MDHADLPVLPPARAQALSLLMDYDSSLAELSVVIDGDPALTATMLRAANAVDSSPLTRVSSAGDALVRVGMQRARQLVLASVLDQTFNTIDPSLFDLDQCWQHLIASALLADAVAWNCADAVPLPRHAAFTAGLLHDVGRLAMLMSAPDDYVGVLDLVAQGLSPLAAEQQVFGQDHAAWGGEVAESWSLGDEIADAARRHHEDGPPDSLAHIVSAGRRMAHELGFADGLPTLPYITLPENNDALASALRVLGGEEQFRRRVQWYRGAFSA